MAVSQGLEDGSLPVGDPSPSEATPGPSQAPASPAATRRRALLQELKAQVQAAYGQDRELQPEEIEHKEFGEEPQVWEGLVMGGAWGGKWGGGLSSVQGELGARRKPRGPVPGQRTRRSGEELTGHVPTEMELIEMSQRREGGLWRLRGADGPQAAGRDSRHDWRQGAAGRLSGGTRIVQCQSPLKPEFALLPEIVSS
ncbi:Calcium-binding protein 1 [Manis javanica]|nr:Calcium-binding protein 1 [Manis javanica]